MCFIFPCSLTVWRIWTRSLIRCCPSKLWTNLKPLPTSCKRYVMPESNLVWVRVVPCFCSQAQWPVMNSACSLQEEMQKAAFQALQLQKDAVHGYIRNQVCVGRRRQVVSGSNLSRVSPRLFKQLQHALIVLKTSHFTWKLQWHHLKVPVNLQVSKTFS